MRRQAARPTPVTAALVDQSLYADLAVLADELRDIHTELGARPYLVLMVWTKWTGGARGEGVEFVHQERALLPTPMIAESNAGLDAVAEVIGGREQGGITVTEVSPLLTEAALRGEPLDPEEDFYFEVVHYAVNPGAPVRRRYTLSAPPSFRHDEFDWKLTLRKQEQNRLPVGQPNNG